MPLDQETAAAVKMLLNPSYPAPWRGFADITRVLESDPSSFQNLIDAMVSDARQVSPDALFAMESFGYLFAAPMAYRLGCPLVTARRPGKLPRATLAQPYEALGIGTTPQREMTIHADALRTGMRVLVVDDVLASGGTVSAAVELLTRAGASVCGVGVAVELARFGARLRLAAQGLSVAAAVELE